MPKIDTAESILTLYNYKLPFPVAEYFCYTFKDLIVCNKKISYKLFKEFIQYKDTVTYVFNNPIGITTANYQFIQLNGIEISIPNGKEEEFMENYSNWIFTSSDDVGLVWLDEEENYTAGQTDLDRTKYIGRCKLTF